ncbi:MAG: ABC transporter permease [Streptococcus salivarius]
MDAILKRTKKDKEHTWYNLYLRAFLRSGDYFALSLRLFALTLLVIFWFLKMAGYGACGCF